MFILVGLLFVASGIPLALRRIKPNPIYGFKTPKTFSSERIWYDANAYSGQALVAAGIVTAIVGLILELIPGMNLAAKSWAGLAVMLVSLIWVLVKSFRYLATL